MTRNKKRTNPKTPDDGTPDETTPDVPVEMGGAYEFRKLLKRLSRSVNTLAGEMVQLADDERISDSELQQDHAFDRHIYIRMVEAAQQLETEWTEFEQGYQAKAYALALTNQLNTTESAKLEPEGEADES